METKNIQVDQVEEDADRLIIPTTIENASNFEEVVIVGEDVNVLVLLYGLTNPTHSNIYFQKCGRGKTPAFLVREKASCSQ